jgi:hypothetical protein
LEQAAKLTGFTPGALRTRRWRGDLPFPLYKASDGHWRADEAEVREWIEKTKREGAVR